jgi:hypothetical protein
LSSFHKSGNDKIRRRLFGKWRFWAYFGVDLFFSALQFLQPDYGVHYSRTHFNQILQYQTYFIDFKDYNRKKIPLKTNVISVTIKSHCDSDYCLCRNYPVRLNQNQSNDLSRNVGTWTFSLREFQLLLRCCVKNSHGSGRSPDRRLNRFVFAGLMTGCYIDIELSHSLSK